MPWIIRNKTLPPTCLTPFYLNVMDCLKYCNFALSIAGQRAKNPDQGFAPGPRYASAWDPVWAHALYAVCACHIHKLSMSLPPKVDRGSIMSLYLFTTCTSATHNNSVIDKLFSITFKNTQITVGYLQKKIRKIKSMPGYHMAYLKNICIMLERTKYWRHRYLGVKFSF